MKRISIAILFFCLGFFGLFIWAQFLNTYGEVIPHFFSPKPGSCEAEACPHNFVTETEGILVLLGPQVVYGFSSYIFSKTKKTAIWWFGLFVVLFLLHGLLFIGLTSFGP